MPRTSRPTGPRTAVDDRGGDLFIGEVRVTVMPGQGRGGPWRLSEETALGLGMAQRWETGQVWRNDRAVLLHACRVCGAPFIAHYAAHLCSPACLAAARAQRQAAERAWREANPLPWLPSKAAQRRAAVATAACRVCGGPVQAKRLTAQFCSNRCRQKHYRDLHAAGPLARRTPRPP